MLRELGAVEPDGHATELGKTLARIPADPRLARALLDGAATRGPPYGGARPSPSSRGTSAPRAPTSPACLPRCGRAGTRPPGAGRRTSGGWRQSRGRRPPASCPRPLRRAGAVPAAEAVGFRRRARVPGPGGAPRPGQGPERYLLTSGTRAGLPAGSPLSGHEWLAVAEVSRAEGRDAAGTGAVIRSAAPLTADTAEAAARHLLSETRGGTVQPGPGHGPAGAPAGRDRAFLHAGAALRGGGAGSGGPRPGAGGAGHHRMVDGGGRLAPPARPAAPGTGRALAGRLRAGVAGPAGRLARPRSSRRWPAGRRRAGSTWPTRCGGCCRGPRPPGWANWRRSAGGAQRFAGANRLPGGGRTTAAGPVVAVKLQECFGWDRDAAAGRRAGCRCCSTCSRRPGGRWP